MFLMILLIVSKLNYYVYEKVNVSGFVLTLKHREYFLKTKKGTYNS